MQWRFADDAAGSCDPAASVNPGPRPVAPKHVAACLDFFNKPYLRWGNEAARAAVKHAPAVSKSPRLRVLFCGNSLTVGGAEMLGVNLARALVQRGHDVTYFCKCPADSAALDVTGINVVDGDIVAVHASREWDAVLHVNGCGIEDLSGRRGNEVVVAQPYGVVPYNYNLMRALEPTDRTCVWAYTSIASVIAPAFGVKRAYALRGGIEVSLWPAKARRRGKRLQLGYVGRIGKEKALDKMMLVALWLHDNGVPCDLWLVGGPDPKHPTFYEYQMKMLDGLRQTMAYRRAVEAGVLYECGLVHDPLRHYQGIDCLLITSDFEGEPVMFLEGMATGCLCVSRDIGEIDRLLEDGRGILIPAKAQEMDEAEIAQMGGAIKAAWADASGWCKMAAAGRKWVLEKHSVEAMAADFEAVVADMRAG